MKINFTQSILSAQTNSLGEKAYLQLNGNFINLVVSPNPTIIVFSYDANHYIVEETDTVFNAWGPFVNLTAARWLYWEIQISSGKLIRNFTSYQPIYSESSPLNPNIDQHWFDLSSNKIKVWNGSSWIEKIRVFAGVFYPNNQLSSFNFESQVESLNIETDVGYIIYSENREMDNKKFLN